MSQSEKILGSWKANAGNWIATIENAEIESRRLVTNDAIINTILEYNPTNVFDIGCGEGWLSRALHAKGINTFGVDAIEELVSEAIKKGGAFYKTATFSELANREAGIDKKFDAAVVNFSLLDEEDTEALIKSANDYLNDNGYLIIQTLHPFAFAGNSDYVTGWKEGSWNGMKRNFTQSYQWYFRTLESWVQLFKEANLAVKEIKEPVHPETKKPVSIIFVLKAR